MQIDVCVSIVVDQQSIVYMRMTEHYVMNIRVTESYK